jgi:hypothetical protein
MTVTAQTPRSGPYSGNGSTTAFDYGFFVKTDDEIVVTVADAAGAETVKTLITDYTVSGADNAAGIGGTVTFVTAPVSTEKVAITRVIAMTQAVDLQNRKSTVPAVLETAYDKLTRITQDHKEQLGRSVKVDLFGSTDLAALTVNLNIVAAIASDVSTVAADGTDIGVVAGISADVTTVAGIAADVNAVAAIDADVATVAADGTDIGVVSGISANVTTVAGISANVTTVAGISADVATVAADGTDIGVVSGISANVTTVAGISANVTTVAGISADVTTVAADGADIGTVAASIADVNAVAAIDADVATVAADGTDIGVVSGISANVTTVAGISANVTTVAGISADVTTVAADGTDIGVVAGISGDVTTVSTINGNVTAVANIASDVTTAADNIVAIQGASTNASDAEAARDASGVYAANSLASKDSAAISATSASTTAAGLTGFDLGAIAESKAITAVDGFVYDTSLDSDGGAWINGAKARASSWYNEALDTATRGGTRAFPAVAVIIAEADTVTIYDGDDPALPMWMVFTAGPSRFIGNTSSIASTEMLNGTLLAGASATGLAVVDFLKDSGAYYTSGTAFFRSGSVLDRNTANDNTTSSNSIVNSNVNHVAMTVLPDAPIDPATGLQVPTIAVATDGGTSVITDSIDGTVADSDNTNAHAYVAWVDDGLWFGRDTQLSFSTYADIAAGDGFGDIELSTSSAYPLQIMTRIRTDFINVGNDIAFCGNVAPLGLQIISPDYDSFATNNKASLSAFITSTYNTGWMHGDIKGAWLSSVDATDLVGTELVTNGDFATDTDWTKGTGWTIGGGVAAADASATSNTEILQTVTTVAGEQYVMKWELVSRSAGSVRARVEGIDNGSTETAAGVYSFYFTANSTTASLGIQDTTGDFVGSVDNISVHLADKDRSVNGNGLAAYGTVTKTAVATGAELMAYSGFSASNYLEQPYNSDLDFGTGDFHVVGWVKSDNATAQNVFYLTAPTVVKFGLYVSTNWGVNIANAGTDTGVAFQTDTWVQFVLVRRDGVLKLYLDGVEVYSVANTADLSTTTEVFVVGVNRVYSSPWDGSMSLLRIGAGAPSAAQIAKTYEDEKYLFHDNALAVLSADGVKALSHDPITDLLYVGGASGMATVSGITPVTRDAVAVTTFIDVVDGMEIKQ